MNTEHFQKSTAYLDGVLISLEGDKVVVITYGTEQQRFYVSEAGEVNRCGEKGAIPGNESDFERYRMAFLEALLGGGSLIIRQLGVGSLALPEMLGGGSVPLDYLSGAEVGRKGVRGLSAEELKRAYPVGGDGAMEFRDFPSKDQVRIALLKQVEAENESVEAEPEALSA